MANIILSGASGRMGKEILSYVGEHADQHKVSGTLGRNGFDGESDGRVIIDFTLPQALEGVIGYAKENKLALVTGTTGLSENHFGLLKSAATEIPVLWAPNMSLGVHFIDHLISQFSQIKKDFDFQIEEFHHNKKLDKPSGTAKLLQKTLKAAVGDDVPDELAVRGGGIYGIHKVWAMSDEEVIQIEHTAIKRSVFAKGAVQAASWIEAQKPGLYDMKSVLGLK